MTLQELFQRVPGVRFFAKPEVAIAGLQYHSRRVGKDDVFFAIRGMKEDGARFIPEALSRGAVAIASESAADAFGVDPSAVWVQVPNVRQALALAAAHWYGDPSSRLKLRRIRTLIHIIAP